MVRIQLLGFLFALLSLTSAETNRKRTVEDLYDLMLRIDENLRKEDRIVALTQAIRIEAILKLIESKLDAISEKIDCGDNLERQLPRDVKTNLQNIGNRIEHMEETVMSLEGLLKKLNEDLQKLDEFDKHAENLKRDINHRLTKMMNVISSLYEMNKELKSGFGSSKRDAESKTELDVHGTVYLTDLLEDMERKLKEQLSILSVELKNEMNTLKSFASSIQKCETPEDDEWPLPGDYKRGGKSADDDKNTRNDLLVNLSTSQSELREEFHLKMEVLDKKVSRLMNVTYSNRCAQPDKIEDNLITAESKNEPCVSNVFSETAESCADLRKSGTTCDGVYIIFIQASQKAMRVHCDMTTDGGGWTVIMRRGDFGPKQITFHQNWQGYKHGFGDLDGEFWLGNDNIHSLTNQKDKMILRIQLESFRNGIKNFTFGKFKIKNEIHDYRLHVGEPLDTKLTSFIEYSNRPFVTYDRIMDQPGDNCAEKYNGAWWFRRFCSYAPLTSERSNKPGYGMLGMQSQLWREVGLLKGAEMKIRPDDFNK